ncbi:MAG: hypothetical protein EZS28_052403, partial [Streblomastix strix]
MINLFRQSAFSQTITIDDRQLLRAVVACAQYMNFKTDVDDVDLEECDNNSGLQLIPNQLWKDAHLVVEAMKNNRKVRNNKKQQRQNRRHLLQYDNKNVQQDETTSDNNDDISPDIYNFSDFEGGTNIVITQQEVLEQEQLLQQHITTLMSHMNQ